MGSASGFGGPSPSPVISPQDTIGNASGFGEPSPSHVMSPQDTMGNDNHLNETMPQFHCSFEDLVEDFVRPVMRGEDSSLTLPGGSLALHIRSRRNDEVVVEEEEEEVEDDDDDEEEEQRRIQSAETPRVEDFSRRPNNILEGMDVVRPVRLRVSRDLNIDRPSNRHAVMGQQRGTLAQTPCLTCQRQRGPFSECVVVPGLFHGACANCSYNTGGTMCSFRSV